MFEGPGAAYHPDTVPGGGGPVGTPGKDHAELNVLVGTGPRLFGCRLILLKYPPPFPISTFLLPALSLSPFRVSGIQLACAS